MSSEVGSFKTFAESLSTPELARRIYDAEQNALTHEALIAEIARRNQAERNNIQIMQNVIADREERDDHMPLWNPFGDARRPLPKKSP